MKIGNHTFHNPVILAPMAGVTDRPFRQLCRQWGADLAVSEMVGANSLIHGSLKTKRRANHEGETRPCSVQIVGPNPKYLAQAAQMNEAEGAEIIDINMGCPAKKVCNSLSGSALLRDEKLVATILETVVKAVQIPVTLKMRTGWDSQTKNGVKIAKIAEACGIQALAVHGRTRNCFFKGEAEYDTIAEIKANVTIPVIANGDINSPQKAKDVLAHTGADGIMIGRAAQGRPWIFQEIQHYFKTGELLPPPPPGSIENLLMTHLQNLYQFYGEDTGVRMAVKHVSWYTKSLRNSATFRNNFNKLRNIDAQLEAIRNYFNPLKQQYENPQPEFN
ncbi:MAG TPA: tRNA dihydrouridine synthase DusB [Gammaproteobacteria bacterium]|nr:tRNA dihydrouridine synthase DusB [Gammaproteobacteria bacterium]